MSEEQRSDDPGAPGPEEQPADSRIARRRASQSAMIVPRKSKLRLWWDWVIGNAIGQTLGLGSATVVAWFTLAGLEGGLGLGAGVVISSFVFGILQGSIVGYFQHRVLHWPLPYLTRATWITATAIGGTVAWLGASSAVTLTGVAGGDPFDPTLGLSPVTAALAGLAGGAILGVPQAAALSRWSTSAWHWVWASALAWAAGLSVVFVAVGMPEGGVSVLGVVPYFLGSLLVAGLLVGTISGVVVVWLVGERLIPSEYPRHVMDSLRRIDPTWLDRNDR